MGFTYLANVDSTGRVYTHYGTANRIVFYKSFMKVDEGYQIIQGTWAVTAKATDWLGIFLKTTSENQNDEIAIDGFLIPEEGVYTCHILCNTSSDEGIMHIYINGVDVAQIDLYSGGTVDNVALNASLGTLSAGIKLIRLKMETKNGSSSDYRVNLQTISIVRD